MTENNKKRKREETDFERNTTFRKRVKTDECIICFESKIKTYLKCCDKPLCEWCFDDLYEKYGEKLCPHCREELFEFGKCYACKKRHKSIIKDKSEYRFALHQRLMMMVFEKEIDNIVDTADLNF